MTTANWDSVWLNVHVATMADERGYGEIRNAAVAINNGLIAWVGPAADLPTYHATVIHDGRGCWMTPGLVDCHTHIVYAGNRSGEFEDRLNGVSYEQIAQRGGGIVSTVRATRAASETALFEQSKERLMCLLDEGVTTVECKSGYGLDLQSEAKILRVARQLGQRLPVTIRSTFLGAHAVPPEYFGRTDAYVDIVCNEMLPALVQDGLVDAVDAFCEKIGFSPQQTERVFKAARQYGLPVKLHAEQLSDQGGAALTAQYHGLSADHLEYLSQQGIDAMAQAGTVAVLLPGAFYFLRETKFPPLQELRDANVPIAIATDCNPGSSPMTSLLLAMNMACTLFRMTPAEALQGVTRNAARALGMGNQIGRIQCGMQADLALWKVDRPADLSYAIAAKPCIGVVHQGQLRWHVASRATQSLT